MKNKIIVASVAILSVFILTACSTKTNSTQSSSQSSSSSSKSSESSTSKSSQGNEDLAKESLDKLVEASQPEAAAVKKAYSFIYSDITLTAEGKDTLVYNFTYNKAPEEKFNAELTKQELLATAAKTINKFKKAVPDLKIKYLYLGSDKSKLGEIVITQEDLKKAGL